MYPADVCRTNYNVACSIVLFYFLFIFTKAEGVARRFPIEHSVCFWIRFAMGLIPSLIRVPTRPLLSAYHSTFVTNLSWEKRRQSQLTTRMDARGGISTCERFILFKLKCVGADERASERTADSAEGRRVRIVGGHFYRLPRRNENSKTRKRGITHACVRACIWKSTTAPVSLNIVLMRYQ